MKRFNSTHYSEGIFNLAMFLLRITFGGLLLVNHGMAKLMHFAELQYKFYSFMGIGSRFSLVLAIFAEVFCSLFIILGLFTRLALIPVIIVMLVAIFSVHAGQGFDKAEMAVLYGSAFMAILCCGPGKVSIDGMINR